MTAKGCAQTESFAVEFATKLPHVKERRSPALTGAIKLCAHSKHRGRAWRDWRHEMGCDDCAGECHVQEMGHRESAARLRERA